MKTFFFLAVALASFVFGAFFGFQPHAGIEGVPTIEESVEDVINECYHDRYANSSEYVGSANICNHIMDMLNKICNQTNDKIFSKCDSVLLSKYIGDENLN